MEIEDISEEINKKIDEIKNKALTGEISLLDVELVSLFDIIKDSLNVYNLGNYSMTFKDAFQLLIEKFEELKAFLDYLDNKDKFLRFLEANPKDHVIYELFEDCWRSPFTINVLSLNFLEYAAERLITEKQTPMAIENIDKIVVNESFFLEIPDERFTEKMLAFFDKIKDKLPCPYDDIFNEEDEQLKIFENFVFLLHLLQLGKIKYQKETNYLYL
ncbi:MAG: hypothetical protein ACFE9Z_16420 [Promethearchaeota archaeon]